MFANSVPIKISNLYCINFKEIVMYHTFTFYQSMRIKNPFLYYTPIIQKEMHSSYLALGKDKFFDGAIND